MIFFGFSHLSDGKITQNLGKVGLWVYRVLWVRKWAPPWLNLTFNPTFITRPFFPIRLLKNSLSFVEKLKLKIKKKNLGGLSTCSYDSIIMPSMFIHWQTDSNNPNRPKFQADHPNFGGIEWKTQKLSVVYSTTNNNHGKKHSGVIGLINESRRLSLLNTLPC